MPGAFRMVLRMCERTSPGLLSTQNHRIPVSEPCTKYARNMLGAEGCYVLFS